MHACSCRYFINHATVIHLLLSKFHLAPKNSKLSCVQLMISSGSPLNVLHFSSTVNLGNLAKKIIFKYPGMRRNLLCHHHGSWKSTLFDTKFEWQGSSLGCCILKPRPPFDLRPLAALQQKGAATYLLEACQDRGSCWHGRTELQGLASELLVSPSSPTGGGKRGKRHIFSFSLPDLLAEPPQGGHPHCVPDTCHTQDSGCLCFSPPPPPPPLSPQ